MKITSETGKWVTLEFANLVSWNADPVEKHIAVGLFNQGLLGAGNYATEIAAKFQGDVGLNGKEIWVSPTGPPSNLLRSIVQVRRYAGVRCLGARVASHVSGLI